VTSVLARLKDQRLPLGHWIQLAETAEEQGLPEAAVFCYRRALELKPDDPALLNNWAWNAMQQPGFNEAEVLQASRQALTKLPDNPDVLDTYAEALWRTGRHQECKRLLEEYRTLTSDHSRLLCFLGQSYELADQMAEALTAYERCREQHRRDRRDLPISPDQLVERIQQLQTRLN
jgi:cytochrome c-type biogenesis protein CcmH/NrfG